MIYHTTTVKLIIRNNSFITKLFSFHDILNRAVQPTIQWEATELGKPTFHFISRTGCGGFTWNKKIREFRLVWLVWTQTQTRRRAFVAVGGSWLTVKLRVMCGNWGRLACSCAYHIPNISLRGWVVCIDFAGFWMDSIHSTTDWSKRKESQNWNEDERFGGLILLAFNWIRDRRFFFGHMSGVCLMWVHAMQNR